MLSETIQYRLAERFAAPLPEFYKRRIVFWHDEDGEFAEAVDELTLGGVTLVKLTGKNNFAVKKLLAADDLTGDYLHRSKCSSYRSKIDRHVIENDTDVSEEIEFFIDIVFADDFGFLNRGNHL